MRIDLHTHSSFSDGTESPGKIVEQAKAAGLDVIALTDHDTSAGWDQAQRAAQDLGVGLIRGMELSTKNPAGGSLHLLSYLYDPNSAVLREEAQRAKDSRVTRAQRMVERIAEDYPVSWEDVVEQLGENATVGRPHIADALVRAGSFPDRDTVFASILANNGPYDVTHYAPDITSAIAAVRQAGGVPVLAHPFAASRGKVADEKIFDLMLEAGLAGLEVDHRDNSDEGKKWLRAYAASHDLIVTGSSDYHGSGKLNRLGENLTDPEQLERLIEMASGVEPLAISR